MTPTIQTLEAAERPPTTMSSRIEGELLEVSMGPQHPSTHGVFRMNVALDGEIVRKLKPVFGYLHRNHEKIGENATYLSSMPYTDRLDYFCSMTNNWAYALSVEKLAGIEVPERAQYLRIILAELTRLQNHASLLGFLLSDMGAWGTPLMYAFREREKILDLFESLSGSRMMCDYMRFGGCRVDAAQDWMERATKIVDRFPQFIDELEKLVVAPGSPLWGSPNVWVNGLAWTWLGTFNDSTLQVAADYYGGPNTGQILAVNSTSQVILANPGAAASTGTYTGGVFVVPGADIRALASTGAFQAAQSPLLYGATSALRIGGLHWNFLGSAGGLDYYAAPLSGERLTVDSSGDLNYADLPNSITAANGHLNFQTGVFTAGTGGATFNAGTTSGDFDILGNILSLGSLANDKTTAGVAIMYSDDISSQPAAGSVTFSASRTSASWLWCRAQSQTAGTPLLQMQLDASNRLSLYGPGNPSGSPATVVLDPGGQSSFSGPVRFDGPVRLAPQGDLLMGDYTTEPSN